MKVRTSSSIALAFLAWLVAQPSFAQAPEPAATPEPIQQPEPSPPTTAPPEPEPHEPPVTNPAPARRPLGISTGASSSPNADTGVTETETQEERGLKKQPRWHDSIFFLDQSITTQTVGIGSDYLSSDPVYELWFSFRPRYYLYETETDALNVNARFDVFLELTNSDKTTREREPLVGDTWLNLLYEHWFVRNEHTGYATKVAAGPRLILGTSKAARTAGVRMQVGAGGSVKQTLPIRGPQKNSFQTIALGGSAYYTKQINRCTTPCDSDFSYTRQDTGGRTLISDQISGASLVNHQLITSLDASLDIIDNLTFGASYIWVLQWLYPIGEQPITTATGPVTPSGVNDPQTFRVSPWILAEVEYSFFDEVDVALGYYNFTNQIGQDGQRRNPLWSPDARFFLTLTAHLDTLYEAATHKPNTARPRSLSLSATPGKL